jgi:hypothetical protein
MWKQRSFGVWNPFDYFYQYIIMHRYIPTVTVPKGTVQSQCFNVLSENWDILGTYIKLYCNVFMKISKALIHIYAIAKCCFCFEPNVKLWPSLLQSSIYVCILSECIENDLKCDPWLFQEIDFHVSSRQLASLVEVDSDELTLGPMMWF